MIELYCAWTIINLIWLLVNIYISMRTEKMIEEANEILDQDEKMIEEANKNLEEFERRMRVHEELNKISDKRRYDGK